MQRRSNLLRIENCPVPTMCGQLRRAMRVPRKPSIVYPINPEELIVRGTAIKPPDNYIPIRKRVEKREFHYLTGRSRISVPLVPENSEVNVVQRSSRQNLAAKTSYHALTEEQERIEKKRRDDEAAKALAEEADLRFSVSIYILKWYNTACMHEQEGEDLENTVPFNQQKQLALEYLHEKMELSVYEDYLEYEMRVQIISDLEYIVSNSKEQISSNLMLSTIISDTDVIENKKPYVVQSGSLVTLTHHQCRIRRNVFCFVKCPIEDSPMNSIVRYHEDVYIRLFCRGAGKPLYLRCESANTETVGRHNKERMLVTVSETVDDNCQFQLQSIEKFKRRFEFHSKAATFTRILIFHTMTRRYLSVDKRLFNGSMILGKEFKACCYTVEDTNKHLTRKNLWVIKTRFVNED